MDKQLRHYIHQLKGKTFPEELYWEFARRLPESYDALKDIALNENAPDIQKVNAIIVLVQIMMLSKFDRRQEVLDVLKEGCASESEEIRSISSRLIVHMAHVVNKVKQVDFNVNISGLADVASFVELALGRGIRKEDKKYIIRMSEKYGVSFGEEKT